MPEDARHALWTRLRIRPTEGILLVVAVVVAVIAGALSTDAIRRVMDAATTRDRDGVLWGAAMFGSCVVVAAALGALATRTALGVGYGAIHRLRVDAYTAVLSSESGPDDAQARLTRDADAVTDVVVGMGPHVLLTTLGAASGLLALVVLSPLACLIALLVVPGSWVAGRWLLQRAPSVYARERAQVGVVTRHLAESVVGAPTLRELGGQAWALGRQADHDHRYVMAVLAGTRLRNRFYPALTVLCGGLTGAVLLVAAWQASSGALTVGAAVASVYALGGVLVPVTQLAGSLDRLLAGRAALVRLCELLPGSGSSARSTSEEAAARPPSEGPDRLRRVAHDRRSTARRPPAPEVAITELTFAYGSDPVVRGLTLVVRPGTMLALAGASGSAKSTTLALVAGTLTPMAGGIRIDGRTRRPGEVMLLAQEPLLVPGTVAENVQLTTGAVDRTVIEGVIELLGLGAWLDGLPRGLDTTVLDAEDGTLDAQAIGLVRAALTPAPLLLLDEATTALDETQEAIVIERLRVGRTLLVASHRPSLVQRADRIAVLDEGRLVGEGGHLELSRSCAAYRTWLGVPDDDGAMSAVSDARAG